MMSRYNIWMERIPAILGAALIGLMLATIAGAANPEPVTIEVTFVDPITITEVNALQFGLLDQNLASAETVVIATNDVVTDAGNNVLGGTQLAANLTVTATAPQLVTILVDTIAAGAGYTLATFICKYHTGADTGCDGAGYTATTVASATLKVGVTLTGDGAAVAGPANGSFNVTVSYQ